MTEVQKEDGSVTMEYTDTRSETDRFKSELAKAVSLSMAKPKQSKQTKYFHP